MKKTNKEFENLIHDITNTEVYNVMKRYRHHLKGSVYDHSVKVAYLCYKHYQRFGTKVAPEELLRGALLHDFYLYDRKNKAMSPRLHVLRHPRYALANVKEYYTGLTRIEQDMILHHMFPLTISPPRTRAGWLICFYDKVAAVTDVFGRNKWKHRQSALPPAQSDKVFLPALLPPAKKNRSGKKRGHV